MGDFTKKCSTCTAWSQLVAMAVGREIQALCLNPASPKHAKYTHEMGTCSEWSDNPDLADLT